MTMMDGDNGLQKWMSMTKATMDGNDDGLQ